MDRINELAKAAETRDFNKAILDIELRRLGHGCPFDPTARCNLAPGDNCARINCPVWLQNGDRVDNQNI